MDRLLNKLSNARRSLVIKKHRVGISFFEKILLWVIDWISDELEELDALLRDNQD